MVEAWPRYPPRIVQSQVTSFQPANRRRTTTASSSKTLAAVAINYFAYNFIKIHRTLRMSPEMAAGVVDRLFDVADLVNLLINPESKTARRSPTERKPG